MVHRKFNLTHRVFSTPSSIPLLKLHNDLLHVVHPLLQLHSLRFFPLRLLFRVLWSGTGCWVA